MATATSRRAPADKKLTAERRALASKRITLEKKMTADNAAIAIIETRLKEIATDLGDSFKELFPGGDYVSVSGKVPAEFKGDVPVIVTEAYLALKPAERHKLETRGIVKVQPQWGKASNGRVTVKVFS